MERRAVWLLFLLLATACAPTRAVPAARVRPSLSPDQAVAAMRLRLWTRGFGPDVTAKAVVAVRYDADRPNPVRGVTAVPLAARKDGAWLVATEAGGWWVWDGVDAGPEPGPFLLGE